MESWSKGRKLMSKYRTTWANIQQQMNEAQSHTVRYTDPLNKKRFAVPFKTHDAAEKKMAQLKKDGVKDIKITMDTLKPGVTFKEQRFEVTTDIYFKNARNVVKGAKIVVDAKNREDAEEKASDVVNNARMKGRWTKPETGGNFSIDYLDNVRVTPTNKPHGIYSKGKEYLGAEYVPEEVEDHEISMARGELEAIADKATQLASMLQGKSDEGNPLEAWVQSKITKAKDYINSVSDYLMYNPDMKQNEENELKEAISPEQLKRLKDSWSDLKVMSPEKVKSLKNFLDKYSTDSLMQLAQANINFVSNMARSVMSKRKMGDPKHAGSMKEDAAQDMEKVAKLRVRQMMIQTKMQKMDRADPKNKTPLAIAKNDLENIQMRMDQLKQRAERERTRPQIAAQKEGEKDKTQIQEKIEGLENKSDKSGISYGILKQVYDRGMAAWKGGHRPGTTPQQWAFARVNSFITKGKTYYTADADLAKKARKN